MKKNRHSKEQIVGILREAAGGSTTKAVCAAHNISAQTFYNWKRKYGAMEISGVRQMRGDDGGKRATRANEVWSWILSWIKRVPGPFSLVRVPTAHAPF